MAKTVKTTRCRANDPNVCKHHGGRKIDGVIAPRPWKGVNVPKTALRGTKTVWRTRQIHGFHNEYRICKKYDLQKMDGYTCEWDAYTKEVSPLPVSIKCKKIGSCIEFGDFFRNCNKTGDFYLHVSFWKDDKYNIVNEYILKIPSDVWQSFFTHDFDDDIRGMLQRSNPSYEYDPIWEKDCADIHKKWSSINSIIKLCPKRDHKKQIRMQCSMSYKNFMLLVEKYGVETLPAS